MDLAGALDYLDRHPRRPDRGLGEATTLARLLHVMGDPQLSYPVIVVAGSAEAATVARFLGALIAESGLTAATLVDTHLEHVGQRLARNGETIDDLALAEALEAVADVEDLVGADAGWEDVVVAAAFGWFAQVAVDVAVLTLGPAGADDPAAVVAPTLTVITATDPAHAVELARLVAPASLVVLGDGDEEVRAAFGAAEPAEIDQVGVDYELDENLAAVGGRLIDVRTRRGRYDQLFVPVHGASSGEAAALALAAAEAFFDRDLDPTLVAEGLATATVPGRFEVLGHGPLLVVDAAGDARGAERVSATLAEDFDVSGRRILVVGLADPRADAGAGSSERDDGGDVADVLDQLGATDFDDVIVTTDPTPSGLDARALRAVAAELGVEALDVAEVADALDTALAGATPDDAIVVAGSAAVAGAARAHLRRRAPE